MTDGGEDVVYYATGMYDVYHHRQDCRYLKLADEITEQRVSTLNGTREPCGVCVDDNQADAGQLVTDGGESA